ncbi:MAG TPA: glycosyltransferase [Pseudonocardiaceae bacterium]|nr:glycosyltransferase [Pseudonocardiaceae bacterium]
MSSDVTVVIPTIPIRARLLRRALASVVLQTFQPAAIVVEYDHEHEGSAVTRTRALGKVTTQWTAFLDDDDSMLPMHLEKLLEAQVDTGADVVYPWPEMVGSGDPRPDRFGVPFDADELRRGSYIPVTSLVRTELAQRVGFHYRPGSPYDDHAFYLGMLELGARFHHLPERTWLWHVMGQNTSGRPDRW